jgi:MYXO-CTERM domain-containing protein
LDATGYVGFWLMTDDAGVQVQIVMDDPGTGEMGTLQDVIADGQWHLYQWNLEDDSQWDGWVNGNGAIDEATVTIDSIYFWGSGDAQIYLDTVSHNPDGMLGAPPIPGDFDGDNDVDGDDLADWKDGFGTTSGALVADGDADDDGDVDGNDFLVWQRNVTPANNAAPVPEPAAGVLALLAAVALLVRRRK